MLVEAMFDLLMYLIDAILGWVKWVIFTIIAYITLAVVFCIAAVLVPYYVFNSLRDKS